MNDKRKLIIYLAISFVLLLFFILIILSKSGILFKLNADTSKLINNTNININFKKEDKKIVIDNKNNSSLQYQLVDVDFITANNVRLIIKNRDYNINEYNKYKEKDSSRIDLINNKINSIIDESNNELNEIVNDISLSDNWISVENNEINVTEDGKDKLIFVKDSNDYYVYSSINSKEILDIEECPMSEEYIKYTLLSAEEKKEMEIVPSICEETIEETDDRRTVDGATYPSKYPENFGTDEFFNNTKIKVKNQMSTPLCVAFASISSLESYLLNKYNEPFYFSERYTANKITRPAGGDENPIGNRTDLDGGITNDEILKSIGFYGAVYEDELPWVNNKYYSLSEINKESVVNVKEILEKGGSTCSASKIEEIKEYITKYGAVRVDIYHHSTYNNYGSYYYDGSEAINHAVSVIGWDDNYPKEKFKTGNQPSRNGAFIVKNSWGAAWNRGINGYFYISYDDVNVCKNILSVQDVDFNLPDNQYFYDYGGSISNVYMSSDLLNKIYYYAIKIDRKDPNEKLAMVKYQLKSSETVNFYITNKSSFNNKTLIGTEQGHSGINTFEFETPIDFPYSSFYLIIQISDDKKLMLQNYPTSTEDRSGKMFYSKDGSTFYDMANDNYSPLLAAYSIIDNSSTNDTTKPKVNISGGGIQKTGGGEVTLMCSDNTGITGYYFGTTNPSTSSMTTTANMDKLTSSGLVKTGLAAGKYYLGCKDAAGNYDVDDITIRKFNVNELLMNVDGSEYPCDNTNYSQISTTPYYVRDGGSITLTYINNDGDKYYFENSYTKPIEADVFKGYSSSYSSSPPSISSTVSNIKINNLTYYMWYTRATYRIKVTSGDNGSITVTSNTNNDTTVTVPAGSTKYINIYHGDTLNVVATPNSGYHLDSWGGNYISGSNATVVGPEVTKELTISGTFSDQVPNYTVTFDSKGGSTVASQTIQSGGKATKPSDPTKTGYTFKHWSTTDGGTAYDFNTAITGNLTLYAVWQINTYTVTFNTHGGSAVQSQTISYGGKVIQPANPTKENYTFKHWSTSENGTAYNFNTAVTDDMTLHAVWEKNTYTVTFNTHGGSEIESQTVTHGGKATQPTPPTRTGYNFIRWSLTENGTEYSFDTAVTGNITLHAVWEKKTYTVTFNTHGGSEIESQTVTHGGKATQPTPPTRTGYNFIRWSLTENGTEYSFDTAVTGNITLHAVWEKKTYTVTFNTHGGSEIESQTVTHGGKATQPTPPTRTGYNFIRWSLTENGTAYDFNTIVTGDMTLYAVWTQNSIQIKDETNMYIRDGKFYVRPTELLYIDKNTIFTNLVSTSGVNIYDKDNNVVSDGTASIATGYKISSGETNYTIIIYGDIDLNGVVNSNDLRLEYNHITAGLNLGELSLSAADFDGDGIVGVNDLRNIYVLITH